MHRDMFKIQDGVAIVEKLNYAKKLSLYSPWDCIYKPS